MYRNDTHDAYWDIDPSSAGQNTVLYTASDELAGNPNCTPVDDYCIREIIERVNLTTGEITRLFIRTYPRYHGSEWHDADRLNATHLVVADMYNDRVLIVDQRSGLVDWMWEAQNEFRLSSGGPYPEDWTHLNDVEVLNDDRIMVSLRNQDRVVFLDREHGVEKDWTLGGEDNYTTLYEQHNPDYIPPSEGGPAVVVGDSENSRAIEYQRRNGRWVQTWIWRDTTLQWPRDVDRLPSGHTLITDSGGDRVIEIDRQGQIVWSVHVEQPYETERLGTGDESTGGPSATVAGLTSQSTTVATEDASIQSRLYFVIRELLPSKVVNGVSNVLPPWIELYDVSALLLLAAAVLIWGILELHWAGYEVRSPVERAR